MRTDVTLETEFQQNIIAQMQAQGWKLGSGKDYHREHALYEADLLAFVQSTQETQWNKFKGIFPNDTERHFLEAVLAQLKKPILTPPMPIHAVLVHWAYCVMDYARVVVVFHFASLNLNMA